MASYQHQHRRGDLRISVHSLDTSWIIESEPARHENVFSDTVSSSLFGTHQSASPELEQCAEQVSSDYILSDLFHKLHDHPVSMIRFPTHDGRGGFTLALSSHQASDHASTVSRHTAIPSHSLKNPSTKAFSTHASTSSSILDDALPRQLHSSTYLSQRIQAWAQEQQLYARLRHKRRRLSVDADQQIRRYGLEGWIWRFVSQLIGIDDQILQIVLGEKLIESPDKPLSGGQSFWQGFLHRTRTEKCLASPFASPHFQQMFRQSYALPSPTSVPAISRPTRQAPTPWDSPRRPISLPQPTSRSSLPVDPIQTAPFRPSPIRLNQFRTESSHAPWGIEDSDILSTSTEIPDDYWDREFTIPIVWHIVKKFISTRLTRQQHSEDGGVRSCKEESVHGGRWDGNPTVSVAGGEERGYYWHESVDGASSLGLGLGGLGTWAEV
jgi:hypothetical protein